jgi:hypothetical protein
MSAEQFVAAHGRGGTAPKAKGRTVRRQAGEMNKQEAEYRQMLGSQPGVFSVDYEAITLKLAPDTRYTPDFLVLKDDGLIELHEVKGFFEDHAKVKIKVAAAQYPMFTFYLARKQPKKDGGGWEVKVVGEQPNGQESGA